jgi:hypothetical protein
MNSEVLAVGIIFVGFVAAVLYLIGLLMGLETSALCLP